MYFRDLAKLRVSASTHWPRKLMSPDLELTRRRISDSVSSVSPSASFQS